MLGSDSIRNVKGIGEKTESLFGHMGIETIEDLLSHYPREYDDFKAIQPIGTIREGEVAAIEGVLRVKPQMNRVRNLKILTIVLGDESGQVTVTWFNMPFLVKQLHMGKQYIVRGRVTNHRGVLVLEQPKIYTKEEFYRNVGKLLPLYPLTAGLTNKVVQKAVAQALEETTELNEFLPAKIRSECHLVTYRKALADIHFPSSNRERIEARRRLAFDELFLYCMALSRIRQQGEDESQFILSPVAEEQLLLNSLPFTLTGAQKKVWEQVKKDCFSGKVMNRLVQGDVGSGKTMIAVLALLMAAKNDTQGAFMAPTEVLAKQHFEKLEKLLSPYGVTTQLLVGSMTAAKKREAYKKIAAGEVQVVVGTHAVIQEKVNFHKLALVITDEQHRFGVKQRETLYQKGREPHVLAMSATPIPRTLALVLYGDMNLSIMDELPADRLPIKNCVVGTDYRPNAYRFIEDEISKGHQVYIICPMVDESEDVELENVTRYSEELKQVFHDKAVVSPLHGRMKANEKNRTMEKFSNGEIQVLVSTTVIEVGIDVPNATVILIENAERFGLAQLHQLRGRVGRGDAQSYCILMAGVKSKDAMERLSILANCNDGFKIAKQDLKLRGQGDLFGVQQSGDLVFQIADVFEDSELLEKASEYAKSYSFEMLGKQCSKDKKLREKLEKYMGKVSL